MTEIKELTHEFIDTFPKELDEGKIYVSIKYHSAAHKCCCGCGGKVITPISPSGWTLVFDGKTITLEPSIESKTFACKSHYFIINNKVKWALSWPEGKVYEPWQGHPDPSENYDVQGIKPAEKIHGKKEKMKKKKQKMPLLKKLKRLVSRNNREDEK